ncbi:hypothetical protein FQR65_LT02349 [Abscondita terminalis]|nr:hypothetical protein FQR65_LT02349 [Abscondita terminalis]
MYSISSTIPKDIQLFEYASQESSSLYAAVLESNNSEDDLVIYVFKDETFFEITRRSVVNGVKLGLISLLDGVCIIVAENNKGRKKIHEKTKVLHFEPKTKTLKVIQHLDAEYANDVVIWNEHHQVFMVLASSKRNENDSFEMEVPIYQWLGRHFDIVNYITTYGARKITPFIIENSHYLAVANFQNNLGKTNIYSEIFKYNRHLNIFESYQKIMTKAAVDVKYFHFEGDHGKEHFLIFANLFEKDDKGDKNYETYSIVYKYIEGYFIPFQSFKLNGVTEWLPIMGSKGEFALFAACKYDGIKIFQYNGWKFMESKIQYTNEAFSKGVVSMRTQSYKNKTLIVVANKNDHGDMTNIFEIKFENKKMMDKFHSDNLVWCKKKMEEYETNRPKSDTRKPSKRQVKPNSFNEKVTKLKKKLKQYEDELAVMEEKIRFALNSTEDNVLNGDLNVEHFILENTETSIHSLATDFLNNENVTMILASTINIRSDFVVQNAFEIDNVISPDITPKKLNNRPMSSIVHVNDKQKLTQVIINGDVVFEKDLLLNGTVNGINFTKENVLLKHGNQTLPSFDLNILATELLDADFINDIDMSLIDSIENQTRIVDNINTLNVKVAHIKGLINNANITDLNEYALRTSGAQTITGKFKFDSLYVDNFNTTVISGKDISEELVLIDGGEYVLQQSAEFVNNLTSDALVVTESFNHVSVLEGELDIMLANSTKVQHVTGHKEFDEVELMNPIKLGGRINNPKIDQMNPVKVTNEEIVLMGDFIINGNLQIEQFLQASDIQSEFDSVTNLQSNGVKLGHTKIPCHLQFSQQINVQDVVADAINDIFVDSLVVMGTDKDQEISGLKTFPGNVIITDSTKLGYVNGVHLPTLESEVLQITGGQTMTGNHQFESIIANRVSNVKTLFGERLWEKVATTQPDELVIPETVVINDSLQIDELEIDSLQLLPNSLINNHNFTFIIEDSVFRRSDIKLNRRIAFENVVIENLQADNINFNKIPKIINESKELLQFDKNLNLPLTISIDEINFTDSLNNMHSSDFASHWLSYGEEEIFSSDQTFKKIMVYDNLFVESGFLNDVNITYVNEDSIKIDEDYHFQTTTFTKGLASIYGITLDGAFESLNLKDIVLSNVEDVQTIVDEITFKSEVNVNGQVFFNGLVSGFNISELCEFTYNRGNKQPPNLLIKGNVFFVKGPEVNTINQVPIRHLLDTVWFADRNCEITGEMEFENVIFQEDVTVHGYVDDIKIQLVAQTYFSKSKNQNISAFYNFDDSVLFENGLYASRAKVLGTIGEINLDEFTTTALLNNFKQIFESTVYLEDCEIRELQGEYIVNDLHLDSEVMRYDQNNVVTGNKTISNVKSDVMKIDKNVLVQNVRLIPWMYDSVMKSGTFKLQGNVSFKNDTTFVTGLRCQKNVNGVKFSEETVMLKSKPQTISGPKYFIGNDVEPIKFESLICKGLINGIDVISLMQQQAYKYGDIVFESQIYFNGSITTPNMDIRQLYQGVNVADLVNNVTHFSKSQNYTENFEKLLEISTEVKESLQRHAYFISYYKVKQLYTKIDFVIPVTFSEDGNQYLACVTKETRRYTIKLEVWDPNAEIFHKATEILPISAPSTLRYIKEIKFRGVNHWYIEHEKTTLRAMYDKYEGSIFELNRFGLQQIMPAILHNGTQYASSMDLPLLNKCVFLLFTSKAFVYCQSLTGAGNNKYWNQFQEFETFNSVEATIADVNNITYIFILNAGTLNEPSSVDLWKFNLSTNLFEKEQSIYAPYPTSVTTIHYKTLHFFAVASGYTRNVKYEGTVTIRKYDTNKQQYVKWQDIQINAPMQVLFAELPTQELVLYVSTNNPSQPLIVYQYEGISKFIVKIVATTIPHSSLLKSFTTPDRKHFILAQNGNETRVIEAVFKGQQ